MEVVMVVDVGEVVGLNSLVDLVADKYKFQSGSILLQNICLHQAPNSTLNTETHMNLACLRLYSK